MREPPPLSDKTRDERKDAAQPSEFGNLEHMRLQKARNMGYLAAAILAGIVLFVFLVLRDYGPESAIRKFHMAVLENRPDLLQEVSDTPITWPNVRLLSERVLRADAAGAKYYVARMDRKPREVVAVVVYVSNGQHVPTVWDVVKTGNTWKIDANRTVTVFRDATGL